MIEDMFGLFEWIVWFVKCYGDMVGFVDGVVVVYVVDVWVWIFLMFD